MTISLSWENFKFIQVCGLAYSGLTDIIDRKDKFSSFKTCHILGPPVNAKDVKIKIENHRGPTSCRHCSPDSDYNCDHCIWIWRVQVVFAAKRTCGTFWTERAMNLV